MQTLNPAYQIALTKARKFNSTVMGEMEAEADIPFLVKLKVDVNTLCNILSEGTEIGNKVNDGEFKRKLMASVLSITAAIFLAETLKYIKAPQKKKLLEQLRKCTVSVVVPNLN